MKLKIISLILFITLILSCSETNIVPPQDHSISLLKVFSKKIKGKLGPYTHIKVSPSEGGKVRKLYLSYNKKIEIYSESLVSELTKLFFEDTRNDTLDFFHLHLDNTTLVLDSLVQKKKKVHYKFPNKKPLKIQLKPWDSSEKLEFKQTGRGKGTRNDKSRMSITIRTFHDIKNLDHEILKIKNSFNKEIEAGNFDEFEIKVDVDLSKFHNLSDSDLKYIEKYQYAYIFSKEKGSL